MPDRPRESIQFAREMRGAPTVAEKALWARLKGRQQAGIYFRRQHTIWPFIVDFFCHEACLVIELDGDAHEGRELYDLDRQAWIEGRGYEVMRFWNSAVISGLDVVVSAIRRRVLLNTGRKPDG